MSDRVVDAISPFASSMAPATAAHALERPPEASEVGLGIEDWWAWSYAGSWPRLVPSVRCDSGARGGRAVEVFMIPRSEVGAFSLERGAAVLGDISELPSSETTPASSDTPQEEGLE